MDQIIGKNDGWVAARHGVAESAELLQGFPSLVRKVALRIDERVSALSESRHAR